MVYKDKEKQKAWFRTRYEKNQKFLQEYKLKHGCVDCGYKAHHAGLEFDHISADKIKPVSWLAGSSMNVILREIAKCEIVCSICHSIRTWNRSRK